MNAKENVTIKKKRSVHTYITMWWASGHFLEKGSREEKGSKYQYMASLVFTAFALEAYLNHVGGKLFACWDDLERPLNPRKKLSLIAERLGVVVKYGERPWQVIKHLFDFRNDIAHGKSVTLEEERIVPFYDFTDEQMHQRIQTKWEKYCTKQNSKKAREDVEKIVEAIHKAAKFEDNPYPFVGGMQIDSAKYSLE